MTYSVVIPTYNYGHMISMAIESVLACERSDVEILVVDDASTDETRDTVSKYGDSVTYLRLDENVGPAVAWGRGISLAQGEAVVKLDADDWLLPSFFERVDSRWQFDVGIVIGSVYDYHGGAPEAFMRRVTRGDRVLDAHSFRERLLRSFFVRMPGLALRASLAHSIEPPIGQLWVGHDWEYLLRATKGQAAALVAEPLAVVRFHDHSVTNTGRIDSRMLQQDFRLMLAKASDVSWEGNLPPDQLRSFRMGLAEQYLRITQGRSRSKSSSELLCHARFANQLSGQRKFALAAAAGRALGAHLIRDSVAKRRPSPVERLTPKSTPPGHR